MRDAFIYDAIRTPRGKAKEGGALHDIKPVALVAALMDALVDRTQVATEEIEDVVLGCVTAIGDQGADIAKIAAIYAGWSDRVSGATVNRFCASGLDAVQIAAMKVMTNAAELVCAGGVESMSRVPIFADKGAWFADPEVAARTGFVHMGVAADYIATRQGISREELDGVAHRSHSRASAATEAGRFAGSMIPITAGGVVASNDELIRAGTTVAALAALPPLFGGAPFESSRKVFAERFSSVEIEPRHTAGTSPGMADGASLQLIGSAGAGRRLGIVPRARIVSAAVAGVDPVAMLRGNIDASRKALERAGLRAGDIDCFEVNESFAAVVVDYQRELGAGDDRLNKNGGAISLGHPLGATGGALLSMAIDELHRCGGRYALTSICGGAGVAAAVIVERV